MANARVALPTPSMIASTRSASCAPATPSSIPLLPPATRSPSWPHRLVPSTLFTMKRRRSACALRPHPMTMELCAWHATSPITGTPLPRLANSVPKAKYTTRPPSFVKPAPLRHPFKGTALVLPVLQVPTMSRRIKFASHAPPTQLSTRPLTSAQWSKRSLSVHHWRSIRAA